MANLEDDLNGAFGRINQEGISSALKGTLYRDVSAEGNGDLFILEDVRESSSKKILMKFGSINGEYLLAHSCFLNGIAYPRRALNSSEAELLAYYELSHPEFKIKTLRGILSIYVNEDGETFFAGHLPDYSS